MLNKEDRDTLYAVIRQVDALRSQLLLPSDSLQSAKDYMRQHGLQKVSERRFPDHGLVQWFV